MGNKIAEITARQTEWDDENKSLRDPSLMHDDIRYLLDEVKRWKDRASFKEFILSDNNQNVFLENDRYWVTGKHLTEIVAYVKKLEAVRELAEALLHDLPHSERERVLPVKLEQAIAACEEKE